MNTLYFADCLDVLQELDKEHKEGFIDLIYIDPPFNSKRDYNILYEDLENDISYAQKNAFNDTWSNYDYETTLKQLKEISQINQDNNALKLVDYLNFINNNFNLPSSYISYLSMMSIRIYYMYRLLKNNGSFYLHCDPTMSHYLKMILDYIFGVDNFRNEITWKRASSHNDSKFLGKIHDIIFFYTKSNNVKYNKIYLPYSTDHIKKNYKFKDERGYYRAGPSTAESLSGGGYEYKWNGHKRIYRFKYEKMLLLEQEDKLHYSKSGAVYIKKYLSDDKGIPLQSLWTNIPPALGNERLGYPTQKPEALLDRIIKASSNEGDLVADFFCGCGTTVLSAYKNKRKFIGIDISHLSIALIDKRLRDRYQEIIIDIKGIPKDLGSVVLEYFNINLKKYEKEYSRQIENKKFLNEVKSYYRRIEFEKYVIEFLLKGICTDKKSNQGSDHDGYVIFEYDKQKYKCIIECKSGSLNNKDISEFILHLQKNNKVCGIIVCFGKYITNTMLSLIKETDYFGYNIPKLELITLEQLLNKDNKINSIHRLPKCLMFNRNKSYLENVDKDKRLL